MTTTRRRFLITAAATAALPRTLRAAVPAFTRPNVAAIDRNRILAAATRYLAQQPITVTASSSPRSTGGPHDFFSEGDYWWPNPQNPTGPYIRRDGMSNPENFNGHREALLRLSVQMPALTAAWLVTRQKKYAAHAAAHLRAWFITPATRMNPNLQYAQAIHGVTPGRGTGIIDTLHLVEVSRAAACLRRSGALTASENQAIHQWFADYLHWMQTSKNGIEERDTTNNHATCWVLQAAAFAQLIADQETMEWCRDRLRTVLIPRQLAPNGSFPQELARTKPYSYSLFNLDVMATLHQILSEPTLNPRHENLWLFATPDGRSIRKAVAFMAPYIADKSAWPYPHDVEYFNDLPVRQPSLLFAGLAYKDESYIQLWQRLNPDPTVPEIIRNFPIRQPLLWVTSPPE